MAWSALAIGTGWLVRGEVERTDLPAGVRATYHRVYRDDRGRKARLDVYTPAGPVPVGGRPALLAFHGGGWRGGSKADYGASLAELATHGLVVVAVDYRLSAPGSPSWPEDLEDGRAAVRWVRAHASEFGIDPGRLVAIGTSAGGHLALMLGLTARAERLRAVVDFCGPTDLRALARDDSPARNSVEMLLGGRPDELPDRFDEASPIAHVTAGSPPVLIFHGDEDALIPIEQSMRLAEVLDRAGVPNRMVVVKGARHGFGLSPAGQPLIPEILRFLEEVWRRGDRGRSGED